MSLPTRKIDSVDITAIGYGAMGFGGIYGPVGSDEERFKLLDRLYELGCTNWDTAHIYGDSEKVIGKWFKRTGLRDKIFLATKFGFASMDWTHIHGDPEFITQQLTESLERLQTDHIDLYYVHRTDPNVPIETTMEVLKDFVKEGKIKRIGLSDASVNTMRRAHAVHPVSAIQIEYSPFDVTLEAPGSVIPTARELGMTIFAYSPTGRGLVTGRYRSHDDFPADDFRRMIPKFSEKNFPRILALVDALRTIGVAHNNATPAQVTIAWIMAQGDDIIPLVGSKQIGYTEENLGAAAVKLSDQELKDIRKLVDEIEEHMGDDLRMPEFAKHISWVETPLPAGVEAGN
ncbi:Aldo keto reductase [Clavulina sp. PMI_390]|nr:Aldo keto reductase [Clavulina sp. PMI_390]